MTPYASTTPRPLMYGLISRRIKLDPEERQRRRKAQQAKARRAYVLRRWAKGLRGDTGGPRKRAWKERLVIAEIQTETDVRGGQLWRVHPKGRWVKGMVVEVVVVKKNVQAHPTGGEHE